MVWPFKGGNIFTLPIITSQEPVLRNNLEHTHFRVVVVLNFQISNRLERVRLLVVELRHPILGFEQTDIEHKTYKVRLIIRFTKLLIKETQTLFFSNIEQT